VCQITEPRDIEEALASDFAEEWKQATDAEFRSLVDNQTWDLVELPSGRKPTGSKWAFKVKHDGEGKVERLNARFDVNVKLEREDGVSKAVDPVLYQSMIGGLLYAAIATRPDISQAVGVVSKYTCS